MISPEVLPPFTWRFTGRNKTTGKTRDYYFTFVGRNRQQVADYIAGHFRNVEPSDITENPPKPVKAVGPPPPEDYEYGHRVVCERELSRQKEQDEQNRWYGARPLKIQPIKLKPLPTR